MRLPPSLLDLCHRALIPLINRDAREWRIVLTLPPDLLTCILLSLTPLSLGALQDELDGSSSDRDAVAASPPHQDLGTDSEEELPKKKCQLPLKRSYAVMVGKSEHNQLSCLRAAWKHQVNKRWPAGLKQRYHNVLSPSERDLLGITEDEAHVDWRQRFWEAHIQECLNEAAAQASAPFYDGLISDVVLPDNLLFDIGIESRNNDADNFVHRFPQCFTLKYQCLHYAHYARYLRLRSSLCSKELSNILSHAKLQHLSFYSVSSAAQVEGLCFLLNQSKDSLQAVELHHCRISLELLTKICDSMMWEGGPLHQLRHFFVLSSSLSLWNGRSSGYMSEFVDFLRAGRYLQSVVLSDNQLDSLSATRIFTALFQAAPSLSVLQMSENELEGLFAKEVPIGWSAMTCPNIHQQGFCFQLKALDLRSNLLDCGAVQELLPCFKLFPFLQQLNLSDNPLGDDGLRALVSCFQEISLLELNISACALSSAGASFLLEVLSSLKQPLRCLTISHNSLGRFIVTPLAKFLREGHVERLDIGDIELGHVGCLELQEALAQIRSLTHLIISKNRLGSAGAALLCKFISQCCSLKVIDCSWNLLDSQCLKDVAIELQLRCKTSDKAKVEMLDLRGNPISGASQHFDQFRIGDKPVVILAESAYNPFWQVHDDDP